MHHELQPDDGGLWKVLVNGVNHASSVQYQRRFFQIDQPYSTMCAANVDRLKICVQNQYIFHGTLEQDYSTSNRIERKGEFEA